MDYKIQNKGLKEVIQNHKIQNHEIKEKVIFIKNKIKNLKQ